MICRFNTIRKIEEIQDQIIISQIYLIMDSGYVHEIDLPETRGSHVMQRDSARTHSLDASDILVDQ